LNCTKGRPFNIKEHIMREGKGARFFFKRAVLAVQWVACMVILIALVIKAVAAAVVAGRAGD
jgi:hypothetical protein